MRILVPLPIRRPFASRPSGGVGDEVVLSLLRMAVREVEELVRRADEDA